MKPSDYVIHLTLSVFLIIGVYQFYFWCQRQQLARPRELKLPIDDWIPYRPNWVWIYSFLYYPVILCINWTLETPGEFTHVAASYLLLLLFQMAFFILFPVVTPEDWRANNERRNYSERFLALVQRFDATSNSFPSMHMSVAILTALHLYPTFGVWTFSFPVLIGLSCLFTKQHYLIDLPAGAVLGWTVFQIFSLID